MTWHRRWERDDPAVVLERKQAKQALRQRWVDWKQIRIDPFGAVWFGKELVMTREESEDIEWLLQGWYRWTAGYRPNLGAGRVSIYARGASDSEVFHDADYIDERIDTARAEQVEVCIDELRWQLRAAIGIHAANKAAGTVAFRNPRLSPEQQHAAYQEAKVALLPAFYKRGLLRVRVNVAPRACGVSGSAL